MPPWSLHYSAPIWASTESHLRLPFVCLIPRRVLLRALYVWAITHASYVLSSGKEGAELTTASSTINWRVHREGPHANISATPYRAWRYATGLSARLITLVLERLLPVITLLILQPKHLPSVFDGCLAGSTPNDSHLGALHLALTCEAQPAVSPQSQFGGESMWSSALAYMHMLRACLGFF